MTAPALPLTPGDQICLFPPGPHLSEKTGQTLTVIAVTLDSLTAETSDGDDEQVTINGHSLDSIMLHYGVTVLHPWRRLARHFPDLLRLTPHAGGGEGRKVEVCEAPRLLTAGVDLALRAFLTAGWMTPDGQATFQPRFEGTVEAALRAGAESAGWEWALLALKDAPRLRPGLVGATVTAQHHDRAVIRHGVADTGPLALARAMRLVSEAVMRPGHARRGRMTRE